MITRKALLHTAAPIAFASAPGAYAVQADAVAQRRNARNRATVVNDPMLKRSDDSAWMLGYWDATDDLIDGIQALRLGGQTYLPKFSDESEPEYNFRLSLTKLTNIYSDIIEGLASKPFEEPISFIKGETGEEIAPKEFLDFAQNVDGSGNTLTVFASETFYNAINSAIDWIYVDFPKRDPKIRTVADAKRAGVRPYWSHVLGRNVLDAQSEVIGSEETLTYMKIFEPGAPDHIREFQRNPDGTVTWRLYEYQDTKPPESDSHFVQIDSGDVSIGVIPMVPLITGRRNGRSWKIFPAMKAAADLQIELYQQESDLKYAKKLTAFPMLAANGIKPMTEADGKTPKKIAVGPSRVLYSTPDSGTGKVGSWSYVEPNAQSLEFLEKGIARDQQELRELGRQPLTAQAGNITVITASVAAGKARTAVKAWAYKLKDSLENALLMTAKWINSTYDPIVSVFVDFDEYTEGEDLEALNAARERGDLSHETYCEELKRRAVLSSNFTIERERKRLLVEVPGDGPDTEDET